MSTQNGTKEKLSFKKLRFHLCGNLQDYEIDAAGNYVRVEGKNAQGKSTITNGVKLLLGGGNLPELLSKAAGEDDSGEIYALLSNDVEVTKTFTRDGFKLVVRHPEIGEIKAGQTWLNHHFDALLAVNPADILLANPADRGKLILEAIPMAVTEDQLQEALGDTVIIDETPEEAIGQINTEQHALKAVAQLRAQIFAWRTNVNRDAKQKGGAVKQLRQSLPANLAEVKSADDVRAERDDLQNQLQALKDEANGKAVGIDEAAADLKGNLEEKLGTDTSAIDEQIEEQQQKIKQLEYQRSGLVREWTSKQQEVDSRAAQDKAALVREYGPRVSDLKAKVDGADAAISQAAERGNTLKIVRQHEGEQKALEEKGERLSAALAKLDAFKARLLSEVNLEGVTIGEDGNLYDAEGVSFEHINTAEQVRIACQVVGLRKGGVVFIDRMESLDTETHNALVQQLNEIGVQVFGFEVSEDPGLRVISGEEAYSRPRPREVVHA